ncbi:hypothetical protein ACQPZF_37250 [Actinosynnema sp. CS-041913]
MELRVEFTACATWPEFVRAVRGVVTVVVIVLVVLVAGGQLPVGMWVR